MHCFFFTFFFGQQKFQFQFGEVSVECLMRLWAFLRWKMSDGIILVPFVFRSPLVTFRINFDGDVYIGHEFVLIYQNRNRIINSNKTHSCASLMGLLPFVHLAVECICVPYSIHTTEFCLTRPCILSHSERLLQPENRLLFHVVNVRMRTVDSSGEIIKPDQAHIPNICSPFISFNFWTRTFDFYVPLSADFDARVCN